MKAKTKLFFKTIIISSWCCAVFVGAGYYYINKNFEVAQNETESVPYAQENPENAGVLLEIDNRSTFLYFDFENQSLTVSINPQIAENIFGYPVDYTIKCKTEVLIDIVDYVDGIDLDIDGKVFRYTGVQVSELLSTSTSKDLRREVVKAIAKKISQNGIGADLFVAIIEKSETNLKLPDCYFWTENMSELCGNIQNID